MLREKQSKEMKRQMEGEKKMVKERVSVCLVFDTDLLELNDTVFVYLIGRSCFGDDVIVS